MAKQPNHEGQIEYRKRLQARAAVKQLPALPVEITVTAVPETQPDAVITDTPADVEVTVTSDAAPVIVPSPLEPAVVVNEVIPEQTQPAATPKTQLQLRDEAVELAATLTEFSDTEYTQYMEELAGTNPQLYAAVVDVIADNNAAG